MPEDSMKHILHIIHSGELKQLSQQKALQAQEKRKKTQQNYVIVSTKVQPLVMLQL